MRGIWTASTLRSVINSTRICAFPIEAFYIEEATRQPASGRSRGDHFGVLRGRWPRLVGGLWRGVNYTVNQLMHSECGCICRGAVGEGGLIRGGLLYYIAMNFNRHSYGENNLDYGLSTKHVRCFTGYSLAFTLETGH